MATPRCPADAPYGFVYPDGSTECWPKNPEGNPCPTSGFDSIIRVTGPGGDAYMCSCNGQKPSQAPTGGDSYQCPIAGRPVDSARLARDEEDENVCICIPKSELLALMQKRRTQHLDY